jgi:predicted porin
VVSLASVAQADEKASAVGTALSSTMLSGYVDTSMQWNLGSGNAGAPNYAFGGAGKADGFNMNVVDLNLEKDADASDGWGTGYKVELWMGPDAGTLATTAGGGLAVKNAYVDLHTPVGNGIEWKIGTWDTPIGYEVADSPNNPNFTRSYGFTLEPTTHTGVQADYTINEMISVLAGIADSFGPGIDGRAVYANGNQHEEFKTWMASVTFTAPKDWGWVAGSSASACIINGYNPGIVTAASPLGADETSYYFGGTLNTPIKELKFGISYDYVDIGKQALTGQHSGYANAVGVFATYQLTEKMSINGRGEYSSKSKGLSGIGSPDKVIEFTATLQYSLWKNVLSRVEARWDHDASAGNNFGGNFGTRTPGVDNSFIFLANVVYQF